jgi:hypothetical protein
VFALELIVFFVAAVFMFRIPEAPRVIKKRPEESTPLVPDFVGPEH